MDNEENKKVLHMTSRKNKVLFVFALFVITINLFTVAQIASEKSNIPSNEAVPSTLNNLSELPEMPPQLSAYNETNVPTLSLWDLTINVTRSVRLLDFGYLTINDTYTIIKHDNITMPVFRFAYPKKWAVNLVDLQAKTMWDVKMHGEQAPLNRTEVYVEHETTYFTFYAVKLTPVLTNSTAYKININGVFLRTYKVFDHYVEEEKNYYNGIVFNYSLVPLLTSKITLCKSSFNKAENGGIINNLVQPANGTIGSASVIFGDMTDIRPMNFSKPYDPNDASYPYRAQIGAYLQQYPPVEAISYKRTIVLDNWYWANVHEEITMMNYGIKPHDVQWNLLNPLYYATFSLSRFHIWIDNAENYHAYDDLSELTAPEGSPLAQKNRLNIYLRIPLMGGDSGTYTLDYSLKLEDILKYEKTEYILKTLGIPRCDFHVRNFELKIVFPQGAQFQYITFGNEPVSYSQSFVPVFMKLGRRQSVSFTATNITSFNDINIAAAYYMSDLAYFIQPLIFAVLIFLICLIYIGVRVLRKDVIEKVIITPEEKVEIPIELIQSFVEKYEEKTALVTRIKQLDEDRRKKKIKAKEYDQQRKILESKMRELIKELDSTKRALKEKGRKYYAVIQKIEISEEKRTSVERSIQDLRIRYIREKQISKDAYLRILRDYQNQIEKHERDIDKEIINLRLLIEHESSD